MNNMKSGDVIRSFIEKAYATPAGFAIDHLPTPYKRNGLKVTAKMVADGTLFKAPGGHGLIRFFQTAALADAYMARSKVERTAAALRRAPPLLGLASKAKAKPPAAKVEIIYTEKTVYTYGRTYEHSTARPLAFQHGGTRARVC